MKSDNAWKIDRAALVLVRQLFRLRKQIRITPGTAHDHRTDTGIQLGRNQESPDPLRPFQTLVTGECKKINPARLHIDRNRPRALGGIHRKKDAMFPAHRTDLFNRKNGPAHIGRMKHQHQLGGRADLLLHGLCRHLARHRRPCNSVGNPTCFTKMKKGTHHSVVLQSGDYYMISGAKKSLQ